MENKNHRPTLDDIAFEGRNKAYGAYFIRQTYQARVFRSFVYSLCFFSEIPVGEYTNTDTDKKEAEDEFDSIWKKLEKYEGKFSNAPNTK